MLKDATTKQEQALMRKTIAQIAANLTEDDALVLMLLFRVYKGGCPNTAATVRHVMETLGFQETRARTVLSRLEIPNFISRGRIDHSWKYTISQDGAEALNYLLDKNRFPGRKIKFEQILKHEKEIKKI